MKWLKEKRVSLNVIWGVPGGYTSKGTQQHSSDNMWKKDKSDFAHG